MMSLEQRVFQRCVKILVNETKLDKNYLIEELLEAEGRICNKAVNKNNKLAFYTHYNILATGHLLERYKQGDL